MATPRLLAVAGAVGALALTAFIAIALTTGSDSASELLALSWGQVTVADLYLGLALAAAWVWHREASIPVRLAWIVALALLGNVALGAYVARAGWHSTWTEFFSGSH